MADREHAQERPAPAGRASAGPTTDEGAEDEQTAGAKRQVRRRLRAGRAHHYAAPGAASARAADARRLAQAGLALADRLGADVVGLFDALPTEPPTQELGRALTDSGRRVLLPRMLADRDLTWHDLHRVEPVDPAEPDAAPASADAARFVLGEDLGREAIGAAGLVFVPALAVDRTGRRLGQGGGSYDRALARVSAGALLVAIVHDDEVLEAVPVEAHDRRVDARLTPHGGFAGWTGDASGATSTDNGAGG
ncbi:5-formyltetrahydrofolate cyclo-ligase [Agilicoccus flavus]|uniref:5-formyltetrahydrofolate cyclo-ligase n=1 Tax=Agilicoccus flavus TaxID=2775968 RepID=UPI001CF71851|nr:5-formyltetrahydrofolate cyclo-ligase [Agilicoccus flavus]